MLLQIICNNKKFEKEKENISKETVKNDSSV